MILSLLHRRIYLLRELRRSHTILQVYHEIMDLWTGNIGRDLLILLLGPFTSNLSIIAISN